MVEKLGLMTTAEALEYAYQIEKMVLSLTYATLSDNDSFVSESHPAIVKLRKIAVLLDELKSDMASSRTY